jgi:hypothetical protein
MQINKHITGHGYTIAFVFGYFGAHMQVLAPITHTTLSQLK